MQLRLTETQVGYTKYQMSVAASDHRASVSVSDYRIDASVLYEGGPTDQETKRTLNTVALNSRTLN